ncbi:hypothetical protein [Trinickia symbiotica]|uniref:hypothetical protein n=1 Tax=Trinickia symbiotica TaxID=863227 RepID=UPI001CB980BA|nr:hypothetical protein [Trinickia symbiotica]
MTKRYEAPLTPLERVLRSASIPEATKRSLRTRFRTLAQQRVADWSASSGVPTEMKSASEVPLADFLSSLGTAWQAGEIRPTHHRQARVPHGFIGSAASNARSTLGRKSQQWLETEPGITAKQLHERRRHGSHPVFRRSIAHPERRVKAWRSNRARELVTRILSGADAEAVKADAATQLASGRAQFLRRFGIERSGAIDVSPTFFQETLQTARGMGALGAALSEVCTVDDNRFWINQCITNNFPAAGRSGGGL